jgi:adenylate cyclase
MATVETAQDEAARRLLARAEREAERVAALVRIVIALVLLVLVQIILWDHMPKGGPARSSETTLLLVEDGRLFLVALLALGALAYVAVRRDWGGRWRPYVTATADAALILGNLHHSLTVAGLTGGLLLAMPTVFLIPLVLAGIAVHYRPWLQLFATALYAAGLLALALLHGAGSMEERMAALQNAIYMFAGPPNAVRLIMLLLIGALLVLAAIRGRTLLRRAVDETVRRGSFARFLPGEISRLVGTPQADSLRAGRRQIATVVFVDIRDSTGRAEALDPRALSVFVSAFRRRVLAAANENDGIVDKFIGDGALVVFGVPEPSPEDAARALAFGADLLRRIERWNDKRGSCRRSGSASASTPARSIAASSATSRGSSSRCSATPSTSRQGSRRRRRPIASRSSPRRRRSRRRAPPTGASSATSSCAAAPRRCAS